MMTRPSKISTQKMPEGDMEKKGGYPSGGEPVITLPKVLQGPGPSVPNKQDSDTSSQG